MSVIEECGTLVDELRDDPTFVDALSKLRGALTLALMASHPTDRKTRYSTLAERLVEIIKRLEARR